MNNRIQDEAAQLLKDIGNVDACIRLTYAPRNHVGRCSKKMKCSRVRTPLQDAIKILKRHRDAMFEGDEDKPISIIISTLAAVAYTGQQTIEGTLSAILPLMRELIDTLGENALIPNPSYPAENFADKWAEKPQKRRNFELWVAQANRDILGYLLGQRYDQITQGLASRLGENTMREVHLRMVLPTAMLTTTAQAVAAEVIDVVEASAVTRPWYFGD